MVAAAAWYWRIGGQLSRFPPSCAKVDLLVQDVRRAPVSFLRRRLMRTARPSWRTGEFVQLDNVATCVSLTVLLERRPPNSKDSKGKPPLLATVALARISCPYERLIRRKGQVQWGGFAEGGSGRDAIWNVRQVDDTSVTLFSGAETLTATIGPEEYPLTITPSTSDPLVPESIWNATAVPCPNHPEAAHSIDEKNEDTTTFMPSPTAAPTPVPAPPPCGLSKEELQRFVRDGVIVIRNGACPDACSAAKAYINIRPWPLHAKQCVVNRTVLQARDSRD